jgi:hypothetical protein
MVAVAIGAYFASCRRTSSDMPAPALAGDPLATTAMGMMSVVMASRSPATRSGVLELLHPGSDTDSNLSITYKSLS